MTVRNLGIWFALLAVLLVGCRRSNDATASDLEVDNTAAAVSSEDQSESPSIADKLKSLLPGGGDEAQSEEGVVDEEESAVESEQGETTEGQSDEETAETEDESEVFATSSAPVDSGSGADAGAEPPTEEIQSDADKSQARVLIENSLGWFFGPLRFDSPHKWWAYLALWIAYMVFGSWLLHGRHPFRRPKKLSAEEIIRQAVDERRHPWRAFFGVLLAPLALIAIVNWDMLPDTGYGWLRLGGWIVGIFLVHGLWAVGPRFFLFVRQIYDNPYNAEALKFLGVDARNAKWRFVPIPFLGRFFKTVVIPEDRRPEWRKHWKQRAEALGTTYEAPSWTDEHVKPRILEWTLLAPLSVLQVVWQLGLDQAFWWIVGSVAWIAHIRTVLSINLRRQDLAEPEEDEGETVKDIA